MWKQTTMKGLLAAVVVGSLGLAPSAFALALTDFALFSLNDQVEILDNVQVTNPNDTLNTCPPQDCALEASTGFIGTGINGVDTAIGTNSTVTGIRTGNKISNPFAHHVTVNGDIVSATGPVKFGNGLTAGNITSGEDIEAGDDAYIGDLNASDEVEIGDHGVLGNITTGTGNIALGTGTTTGTQTTTGVPLIVDPMVPTSLPVTSFTGEGNTFVNGQVFTPGQYFFDHYLPDKNQGVTFDFTQDPTGKIEIFVEGITRLQQNFDITVKRGGNSCTVAEIFTATSGGSCTDPLGLRPLAGQVVLESHGLFQIRDGADFFGTGIVPVALSNNVIGLEVKGQGSTGFVIGALYAVGKVKLRNDSQLQYVGMVQAPDEACTIPVGATGAAHEMEEAADAIHGYLHDVYPGSPAGSAAHELEDAAAFLHDSLHDGASCNVIVSGFNALSDAWDNFKDTMGQEKLTKGDNALDALFDEVDSAWDAVEALLDDGI